jgi:Flp pilus assembly protein TadG
MRLRSRLRHHLDIRVHDERGVFLVWFALMLVTLLAMAGFAIDFARWNREGSDIQKAADAAALAGAVYMPDDFTGAQAMAAQIAEKNGYKTGTNGTTITALKGSRPNQLKVRISRTVTNLFGSLVGANSTTISKSAVGEYQRAVNMGSPSNQFGNNPEGVSSIPVNCTTAYPCLWANVSGPNTDKVQGDAIQAKGCGSSPDNCPGGISSDYDAKGYYYGIEVLSGATSPLTVQAFDPSWAEVGLTCTKSGNNLSGAAALPAASYTFEGIAPSVRYSASATSPYCTGDNSYSNGLLPVWTTYQLRAPDATPWFPDDNPVICSAEFPGYTGNIATALQSATSQAGAPTLFKNYFRRWYTLCTVNNPVVGSYFLQIQTVNKANGTVAPNGHGMNHFSVRAGIGGSYSTTYARVYGEGRMSMYGSAANVNATFYLARVLPGAQNRSLEVSFFDIGDSSGTGTLQVVPPPDSNVGTGFPGCTYTPPPGNSTGPPWGSFSNTGSNCKISNVTSAGYQGQWIQLRIPIPNDYACNTSDALGCWSRIVFSFNNTVTDVTTWNARILGIPVRLIE